MSGSARTIYELLNLRNYFSLQFFGLWSLDIAWLLLGGTHTCNRCLVLVEGNANLHVNYAQQEAIGLLKVINDHRSEFPI